MEERVFYEYGLIPSESGEIRREPTWEIANLKKMSFQELSQEKKVLQKYLDGVQEDINALDDFIHGMRRLHAEDGDSPYFNSLTLGQRVSLLSDLPSVSELELMDLDKLIDLSKNSDGTFNPLVRKEGFLEYVSECIHFKGEEGVDLWESKYRTYLKYHYSEDLCVIRLKMNSLFKVKLSSDKGNMDIEPSLPKVSLYFVEGTKMLALSEAYQEVIKLHCAFCISLASLEKESLEDHIHNGNLAFDKINEIMENAS